MEAPPSKLLRLFAGIVFFECVYLLVPWQAIHYGRFAFELNQDLLIWAGAPLAWLMARALWKGRTALAAVMLVATWCWLVLALRGHYDPHAFGPRTQLLMGRIGWVPLLNTGLLFVLAVLGATRRQRPAAEVPAR